MQLTCGNCGKPVGGSDITCPHCGALLAAYASPTGATAASTWSESRPVADLVPPVAIEEPAPAPKIVIPDKVEAVSSAPRPLFDTNVTIDELMQAAEGDHGENLVVVKEEESTSKPVVFESPDYARPPSAAEPVPVVEDADAGLIARPTDAPAAKGQPVDETSTPVSESWLADTHDVAPAAPRRRARRDREVLDAVDAERGRTEDYLRKLHSQAGYDSSQASLSRPIVEKGSRRTKPTKGRKPNDKQAAASLERSRKGCLSLLVFVLFFLWLGVVGGILTGDMNPGLLFVAVAFSFLARFIGKPFSMAGKK